MWNEQAPLGLSVGATNLAAVRDGRAAVIRQAATTLHGQHVTGFVDRVGDPVPLIAADGSAHRPEILLADALYATAADATGGMPAADVTVTVPAHWRPQAVDALRRAMAGIPVVSDAAAAVAALTDEPGLPTHGVVVLCDFGGSGSSITLVNAASDHSIVGETVRYPDFSGDLVDQAVLRHVAASLPLHDDPSGTAMVGSLARLRDDCRRAKEMLSAQTATAVGDIRVTRHELEQLLAEPFSGFLVELDLMLERYGVPRSAVTAVATVGGGARIPLITQLLSDHLRAPVVTTPQPQLAAARGAAVLAARSRVVDTATTVAPAAETPSAPLQALAWSQDTDVEPELPYVPAEDYRPELTFEPQYDDDDPVRRTPLVLFTLSAVAVILTTAVFAFLQLSADTATPVEAATTVAPSPAPAAPAPTPAPPAPQAPQATTVVVQRSIAQQPRNAHPAPAQRSAPQPAAPPAPPATTTPPPPPMTPTTTAPPPTTTPPTTPPTTTTTPTTPPSTPPTTPPSTPPPTPPSTPPSDAPLDPGPGGDEPDSGTETAPPPAEPEGPTDTPGP